MVLEIVFALIVVLFVLMSFVLEHHWRRHGNKSKMLFVARIFYYGGSAIFFLTALALLMNVL